MQRLRIRFLRGEQLKYISHLDIMRLWSRAFTRAGIDIAYTEGFNPHPKIAIAAPLATGTTSEAELMDVVYNTNVSPNYVLQAVNQKLPGGMKILQVHPIPVEKPSLQALVQRADYKVCVCTDKTEAEITSGIDKLLALEELPWQQQRNDKIKKYDLRALVIDIKLKELKSGVCRLYMALKCDSEGSGRPEQVTKALGFDNAPTSVHRVKLLLKAG